MRRARPKVLLLAAALAASGPASPLDGQPSPSENAAAKAPSTDAPPEASLPEDRAAALQAWIDEGPLEDASLRLRLQTRDLTQGTTRLYQRATLSTGRWQLAAVAERDPGEQRLFDHVVAFGRWRSRDDDRELAVGSLRPGFGQGLLFGRGAAVGVPSPRLRSDSERAGYRSATENRSLRGVFGRWRREDTVWTGVVGRFHRDARVDEDGTATSLPDDGIHDAPGEPTRRRLSGTVAGGRVTAAHDRGRVGITFQGLAFDRHLDLRRAPRVAHGFRGRRQVALATDAVVEAGPARLWAAAARVGRRHAALAGLSRARLLGGRLDVLGRVYEAGFFSPFGGAASGNGMTNERGLTVRYRGHGWLLWLDDLQRPSTRWTEPVPGRASAAGVRWQQRLRAVRLTAEAQPRRRSSWTSGQAASTVTDRVSLRGRWARNGWQVDGRLQTVRAASMRGAAAGLSGRRRGRLGEWAVQATGFATDGFPARVYEAETALPGTVSIRSLYGVGWRLSARAGWRAGPLQLWCQARHEDRRGAGRRREYGLQIDLARSR